MFRSFLPLYSARYLFPALPKKFVIKIVIIKQKLIVILIDPRVSAPKVRPTKKLKIKGVRPIKINASPVYKEFLTSRVLKKENNLLIFLSIKIDCKGNRK